MSLPLSFLICLSVFHLCLGTGPVEELIKVEKVHLLEPWSKKSPESKDVNKAVKYAVERMNNIAKGRMLFKLVSVTSAEKQESSKIKYQIDAIVKASKCPKWKNYDIKSCILDKTLAYISADQKKILKQGEGGFRSAKQEAEDRYRKSP
ncbi:uncharacterized protein LOC103144587 isoform X1 [Poecilia formosa]|uniref:uncharacterized protein LOC103144587 isoform X1 n=1 Tax=Poecilia formosa TaxID=48698 RepID=UPI0007BABC0F|nr:PREDICTED: uncharacterized protein LOC103144587 isoform X1 [Poecilia formosa]